MDLNEILLKLVENNESNIAKTLKELKIKIIVSEYVAKDKVFYVPNTLEKKFGNVICMNPATKHKLLSTNKWLQKYFESEDE